MNDQYKTKAQLIAELNQTRKHLAELERVEEMLGVSEEKYGRLFELSPIGITTLDMKGVITSCNPAVARKGGYSAEELIGKHFSKLGTLRARDIPKHTKMFASIIKGKVPKPFEVTYQRKDGTIGWSEIHIALLQTDGRKLGVQVVQRDITECKQAEQAMRASEERYRSLVESTDDAVYLIDRDMRYEFANKKYLSRLGLSSAELIRREYGRFHPSDIREEFVKKTDQVFRSGKPMAYEHLSHRDNKCFLRTLSPVTGEKPGEIRAITVTSKDITERKKMEEVLKESEEMYRSLIERANDGIAIIQNDGIIRFVNDRVAKMVGYEVEELRGKQFQNFIPAEDIEELTERHMQRIAGVPMPSIYEISLRKKSGKKIYVEINAGLIQHEGKAADLAFIRDITERKRAEEALAESERRYRELVEAASDIVFTTDSNGHFTYVNPPAKKLTGYSEDRLIGMHFTELISPDWQDHVRSFYVRQRDNLVRNSSLEFPIVTHAGEEKWVEQKVTMIIKGGQITETQSILRDITERKKSEEVLTEMATIDPLTSLFNRRRFSEFLEHEIERTKRYKTELSIIMFDIDHFKKINDTYGHKEGDKVLKLLGTRMKDIIRDSDVVARWGGEEFMVLAVNADTQNAQIIAEKIRTDIESQRFPNMTGFTVSAGVTQFGDGDDAASLIDRADRALYHAKNNGRNQVQVA